MVQQEFIADGNANGTATLEDILTVLSKLNTVLLYHPAITELKWLKWVEMYAHQKSAHLAFIAAIFIIVNNWKKSRCPSIGE